MKDLAFIGHPNYFVGDDGSFWKNTKSGMKRRYGRLCRKHIMVGFGRNTKNYYLHHLILMAFVGPRPKGMECRHLDDNPRNNKLTNLKWGTREDNMMDRARNGIDNKGSRNGMSKLTEDKVRQIKRKIRMGARLSQLAIEFNISRENLTGIRRGRTWSHVK